ncbi:hypothetical protein GCM10025762_02750 [Haloechinothrix salitolerans]
MSILARETAAHRLVGAVANSRMAGTGATIRKPNHEIDKVAREMKLDKAKEMASRATEKATEVAGDLAERVGPLTERIGPLAEKAGEAASRGVETAAGAANRVTGGRFEDKISSAADKMESVLHRDATSGESQPGDTKPGDGTPGPK